MEQKADVVIADLPCSGLGIIGRKPDIKYNASMDGIRDLAALQRQMLSIGLAVREAGWSAGLQHLHGQPSGR